MLEEGQVALTIYRDSRLQAVADQKVCSVIRRIDPLDVMRPQIRGIGDEIYFVSMCQEEIIGDVGSGADVVWVEFACGYTNYYLVYGAAGGTQSHKREGRNACLP